MAINTMEGKYILRQNRFDESYEILKEKIGQNLVYETVIPDAGQNKSFAFGLLSLLNSQGSEVGQSGSTNDAT